MKTLLIVMILLLSSCTSTDNDTLDTLEAAKKLALSSYELGYAEGFLDGRNNNFRPLERSDEIREFLNMKQTLVSNRKVK